MQFASVMASVFFTLFVAHFCRFKPLSGSAPMLLIFVSQMRDPVLKGLQL